MELKYGVEKLVRAKVGGSSLIGVSGKPPHSWGNYFTLWDDDLRVLNFWAENLEAAKKQFLHDGMVKIIEYPERYCIIWDDRIPKDWYYNKLCFTGARRIKREYAAEIFEVLGGDPTNELELWDDPVSYYAKRGATYDPKTGFVVYRMNTPTTIIKGSFNAASSEEST